MTNEIINSEMLKTIHEWAGDNLLNKTELESLIWMMGIDEELFEKFTKVVKSKHREMDREIGGN